MPCGKCKKVFTHLSILFYLFIYTGNILSAEFILLWPFDTIEYIFENSKTIIGLETYSGLLFIYFEPILGLFWSVDRLHLNVLA